MVVQKKLAFNSDKNNKIVFDRNGCASNLQIHQAVIMYESKPFCKILGAVLDNKLLLVFHIQKIKTKLGCNLLVF